MRILKVTRNRKLKNRRSRRAISTIMANLTMLVIVITLASLLFVWATSSFGAYTGGAGYWFSTRSIANQERPSVENVYFSSTGLTVYVRNVGTIPFTISSVYLNGTHYNTNSSVLVSQVSPIPILMSGQSWVHGDLQTVRIATFRGTLVSTTWVS